MIFYENFRVSIAYSAQKMRLENGSSEHQGRMASETSLTTRLQYQIGETIPGVYVRRTAVVKVIVTYIQKRILRVVTSQGPVEG